MMLPFLVENKRALETLAAWIRSGRFPHAVLIEGQPGSGRKTFGRMIAQVLLCSGTNPPCKECSHCRKVEKDIHPDFITVQGKGGARSFHIDAVREIRTEAYVHPNEGHAKVFFLLDTQEMTVQAQNALLKIMEEPPKGVYFLLICENRQQMLQTIQSRAVPITMQLPDVQRAAEVLAERIPDKTPEAYHRAALQAGGNIGQALILLEDSEAEARYQQAQEVLAALLENRELDALANLEDCQRDRPLFVERLGLMRSFVVAMLLDKQKNLRHSPLQLGKIVDIMDEMMVSAQSNVNMLLLITLVCSQIRAVLSEK